MRSWTDPIANVDTVERREISGKIFPFFLEAVVWLPYRLFQECIWLHLLELLRKIMLVTEKKNKLIRQ
jgi:hypothetical protein